MENLKEFRFVVNKETLDKLKIDASRAVDFVDYYIQRNKRVRHLLSREGDKEFVLIASEPGMIVKRKMDIKKDEAERLMKETEIIVKKQGIGHLIISNIEGYCEKVTAIKAETEEIIFDEIQIEFEQDQDKIPVLKREIKPLAIVNKGLYDYISERIGETK